MKAIPRAVEDQKAGGFRLHQFYEEPDIDLHQTEKSDPDPYQGEKPDLSMRKAGSGSA